MASFNSSSSSHSVIISDGIVFTHLENAEPFNDDYFFEWFNENRYSLEDKDPMVENECITLMNRFLICCTEGSQQVHWIYEERSIDENEVIEWNPLTPQKGKGLFSKYNYNIETQPSNRKQKLVQTINVFDLWSSHKNKRLVASITFHPRLPPGFLLRRHGNKTYKIFNTWTGFWKKAMQPLEEWEEELADERKARILFHLKEVLSRGDEKIYLIFLEWMASIIQKPWEKIHVVPVCTGIQGAGKSMFWENFAKIFGIHGLVTPDASMITDKYYGADLAKKIFVTVAETNFQAGSKDAAALKNSITSQTRKAEKKFQDIKIQKDFVNMALSSNDTLAAFPVEKGGNRRWFLVESDGHRANQPFYFGELNSAFNDDDYLGLRAFYFFLLQHPLGSIDLRTAAHTEEKKDAVMNTFNELETWWWKCLEVKAHSAVGPRSITDNQAKGWETEGSSKNQMYEAFMNYLRLRKNKWGNEVMFENEMKKCLPPIDEDLAQHPYSESVDIFTMPRWKTCMDYFSQLKGLTNPLKETIKNKKRAGEPLSNDRAKITAFMVRRNV